jgi:hypothetical protein
MGVAIERPALRGELDVKAAPIVRMIDACDHALLFELVDDAGHRAQPDVEVHRERPHRLWPAKVENPEAVRLRHGERTVQAVVETPELVQRGEGVQSVVELEEVGVRGHLRNILRQTYYTCEVV